MRVVEVHRWQIGVAFIAVTSAFVVQGVLLTQTIHREHQGRILSCQRTYEGVREIFRPFFRPAAKRTIKERHDIAKFNRIIDERKAHCVEQVSVEGG